MRPLPLLPILLAIPLSARADTSLPELSARCMDGDKRACLELTARAAREDKSDEDPSVQARRLGEALKQYNAKQKFKPGQIVQWKQGLRNKSAPSYGQPAIVVEVLATPIFDETESSGSPYFREPLDIRLAIIDRDGDFVVFYYDAHRFESFDPTSQKGAL